MAIDILEATRAYESWLGRQTSVVRKDLLLKHERMALNPFVFLRGTFYRWIQQWPDVCASLLDAPKVRSVGDLHVENFGTWRDLEGRLVWGVNDADEACELPYTNDLVRLATSAILAIEARRFALTVREACKAILEGYAASRENGGRPVVLAERRQWLRRLALSDLRDPVAFWERFESLPSVTSGVPRKTLQSMLPAPNLPYRVMRRVAGVGSLGRPRFVALAFWGGARIAREAKALVPSASAWARRGAAQCTPAELLERAVRVPDPFYAISGKWIVRRLAPDCSRIELAELPGKRDERKLLRAMGWETANIHLGTRCPAIDRDLRSRPRRWLVEAALRMAGVVKRDWRQWAGRTERRA
jgi:Uncharacterized protein conserved in bacteria (DUF2252)